MNILLTGSTGSVGKSLADELIVRNENNDKLMLIGRYNKKDRIKENINYENINITGDTYWMNTLKGIDCVIHLAAVAHLSEKKSKENLEKIFDTNTSGTINLAWQAGLSGVKKFIFISSIGVNCRSSSETISVTDQPSPIGIYAKSKFYAEESIKNICKITGMSLIIIRPPLIYGKNTKGSFKTLTTFIKKGIPLPFGRINNKRSFLGIQNFISFVNTCIHINDPINCTVLLADNEVVSTSSVIRQMIEILDLDTINLAIPEVLLEYTLKSLGLSRLNDSLIGSLPIDISHTCELFKWSPPFTFHEQLRMALTEEPYHGK